MPLTLEEMRKMRYGEEPEPEQPEQGRDPLFNDRAKARRKREQEREEAAERGREAMEEHHSSDDEPRRRDVSMPGS